MYLLSILFFFISIYCFGFTLTSFIKKQENLLEKHLMRLGIGLGAFVVIGVILTLMHIPLDWRTFFALSVISPLIYSLISLKNKSFAIPKIKLSKENFFILIVLMMFLFSAYMYIGGAFNYPYLEDDDPWEHAVGVKYISMEKTAYRAESYDFQYFDPYPPGYDLMIGVLHQTNDSVSWTLKFFNGLILALGSIFFYFFAKEFTGDKNKALFATFILASLPSFFTHFIWAHSLVIILFFPAMYSLEMIKHDKKWMYAAMVLIASIILTQPTKAIKILIMISLYYALKSVIEKSWNKEIVFSLIGAFIISLTWWITRWKVFFLSQTSQVVSTESKGILAKIISAFPPESGTATRPYTFQDFFTAQPFGGINVHVGWGVVVSILLFLSIFYITIKYKSLFKKENTWIIITIFWFIFTFLGTNSMTFNLPIGLYAFRFWLLMAIPVALLSTLGAWFLIGIAKNYKVPSIIIIIVLAIGIFSTSTYQKYNQNHNAVWPPGVNWGSMEEIQGYEWLNDNLAKNTKIYGVCGEQSSNHLLGFDMLDEVWNNDVVAFNNLNKNHLPSDSNALNLFLKGNQYSYFVIDSRCVVNFDINQTNAFVGEIINSGKFAQFHQSQGMILFKVL